VACADYEAIQDAKAAWKERLKDEMQVLLADGQIRLSKDGQPYINHLLDREPTLVRIIKDTACELGLSPTARTRLHATPSAKQEKPYMGIIG
jgi:P27 family predicted phage terminase small subunit